MSQANSFLKNLTGLRFVGALMVFCFHFSTLNAQYWTKLQHSFWFEKIKIIFSRGHFGINLFFVLSGFLITHLLIIEFQNNGKIAIGNFIARRSLRIWPLYFLVVLFGFFIFPHLPLGTETIHSFWRYALFLSNFDELYIGLYDTLNFLTVTWSISVEEQFYLTFAGLLVVLKLLKSSIKALLWFFILLLIASLSYRFIHLSEGRLLYYHSFSVMSDICIGGITAFLFKLTSVTKWFRNLDKRIILLIYIIGCVMLLFEERFLGGPMFIFHRLLPDLFFAFIILEQILSENSFWQADNIPFFKLAGKISYGFYLFHSIIFYYLFKLILVEVNLISFLGMFVLSLICSMLLAYLSFTWFEKPILRLKRFFR